MTADGQKVHTPFAWENLIFCISLNRIHVDEKNIPEGFKIALHEELETAK